MWQEELSKHQDFKWRDQEQHRKKDKNTFVRHWARTNKFSFGALIAVIVVLIAGLLFIWFIRPPGGGVDFKPRSPNLYYVFRDTQTLFHTKSTKEIYSTLFIFQLCQFSTLFELFPNILAVTDQWGVSAPFYWVIKRTLFQHFCAGETLEEAEQCMKQLRSRTSVYNTKDAAAEDSTSREMSLQNTANKIQLLEASSKLSGVSFVPLKITSIAPPELLEKMTRIIKAKEPNSPINWNEVLSSDEYQELKEIYERLDLICEAAKTFKVSILLDAEQTFRQPAVDQFAIALSRKFNRDSIVLYNTYQMYLTSSLNNLISHLNVARKEDFYLGAKLVRGAYIVTESRRAKEMNYPSPILPSKLHTDQNYHLAISHVLTRLSQGDKCGAVVATHSLDSVMQAAQMCIEGKIPFSHPNLHFAQLKGMGDHLSLGLEHLHANVHKLMPYGPITQVVPYLIRRAQENKDIFGGIQLERELLWIELKRRKFGLA